ncbi:MAG: histidine phosphatase family protein [Hydrogenophaga sp.]|uniref:histidine phosphatase family protein n=1 Tax=Hydrogenophaga sp. TaxID=1904254 RepID=UPI001D9B09D6|nr:histidine phosphatase family protein [Hydrogenophaga sp.]MBX3609786.1 histidine phosphatase family protein [Hydrogenophaga sp.]
MKLWLIRHAAVALPDGLCYGITDAPARAEATVAAAQAAAAALPRFVPLWVSGLTRAQQLAAVLQRERPDLGAARVDTRLNEMDFGRWEMQPWAAVPRAAFDDWMADFALHRFGGEECTQQVIDRVASLVLELHGAGIREAAWVTHAGVIRAASYLKAHGPRRIGSASEWPREAPAQGELQVIEF